ncbi:acyl-CoA thioesterase II [Rhodobacterales bacterium HKCCE2091]|nr:acyl-CoA thioesterase II [Rhodobacterales bacterium HKCCE2091]
MTDPVDTLLSLLRLERLEEDLFRGPGSGGETARRIFGGQVVAQALAAASMTVPEDRPCHSLHAYFMRPGDPSRPVIYEVDRARDGGSFTTRRVVAIQSGRQILNLAASFHVEEPGFAHADPAPEAPAPETLPTREEAKADLAARADPARRAEILRTSAIEVRLVDPIDYADPKPMPDSHSAWIRLARPVTDAPAWLERCLLAYASDLQLLGATLRPHGESGYTGRVMTASLDHAVWFHGPVRFSGWHLYSMHSPWAGGARGLARGQIHDRDGRLVASVVQEGLIRPKTRG